MAAGECSEYDVSKKKCLGRVFNFENLVDGLINGMREREAY